MIDAQEILNSQDNEGRWGLFHSLSEPSGKPITTEQALRRLERLGFTYDHPSIQLTIAHLQACLRGDCDLDDVKEVTHNWDIYTELMLATWIRRFTDQDQRANQVARQWAKIISKSFQSGVYKHSDYLEAYLDNFKIPANGDRLIDFVNFYTVSLTRGEFSDDIEALVFDHIMNHNKGIYYFGYRKSLLDLPDCFESKQTTKYLASLDLLIDYKTAKNKLSFVREWLEQHMINNTWDLGVKSKDRIYLPTSPSWRKKEDRIKDTTDFVRRIYSKLIE